MRKDGLLPLVIKRLQHLQPEIEAAGHKIRFAVARGPLNIASFLMGAPEFCEAIKSEAELMQQLLGINGRDFEVFGLPHLKRAYDAVVTV